MGSFDGGAITSNGGAALLREVDRAIGLTEKVARCFRDARNPALVEHRLETLVAQRVHATALGYEDLNDHDELRFDPGPGPGVRHTEAQARGACTGEGRRGHAGAPAQTHRPRPRRHLNPLHGQQEDRFFHGYYRCYCYLPLYIFADRHLLVPKLRRSNIDASAGAREEIARIVAELRKVWPDVEVWIRADSGFARDDLMSWCEENRVEFVLGLARNARLEPIIAAELAEAKAAFEATGKAARVFKELAYRTVDSWSRERRVVAKAEHLE